MKPQNPQLDGQLGTVTRLEVKRLEKASNEHSAALNDYVSGVNRDWQNIEVAGGKVTEAARNVSTDNLVQHLTSTNDPTWNSGSHVAAQLLVARKDITPEHIAQLAMHANPELSHRFVEHTQATDEHRALHFLSHPRCQHCDATKIPDEVNLNLLREQE